LRTGRSENEWRVHAFGFGNVVIEPRVAQVVPPSALASTTNGSSSEGFDWYGGASEQKYQAENETVASVAPLRSKAGVVSRVNPPSTSDALALPPTAPFCVTNAFVPVGLASAEGATAHDGVRVVPIGVERAHVPVVSPPSFETVHPLVSPSKLMMTGLDVPVWTDSPLGPDCPADGSVYTVPPPLDSCADTYQDT
jgi:hypothetical protein